ncbi:keratin, type I cytoskeletal 47 kDa-like [Carcharodon carcharias]|uniref:keratin, type I cytoskeletal 47 kDa-like n=1 Tax=Carcharodon carcharias TaxID=13397 RepID=UPI001B7EA59B|nr:keratin, type I cytoskeletal 47 kDa-like [Carcharodon carcharias]
MTSLRKSVKLTSSSSSSSSSRGVSGGFSKGSSQMIGTSSNRLVRSAVQPGSYSSYSLQGYGSSRPRTSLATGIAGSMGLAQGYRGGLGARGGSSSLSLTSGGLWMNNEKDTMQNLNQRLSSYLDKVRSLELANSTLEKQIQELVSSRTIDYFDWSIYKTTVKPLQQQIISSIQLNTRISLEVDNARLAAEDFKNKWESELILRQSVESDINGLHQLKDTYLQLQTDLAHDVAGLEDEIAYLTRNHNEDLKLLRQQKTRDIQVEVDAAPSVDLAAALEAMRENYTKIADTNQKDLDDWYKQQVQIQVTQTTQSTQALDASKGELIQLRQQMQTLDAEYNSLRGTISALQNALNNTDARYDMELRNLLARSTQLEGELGNLLNSITQQSQEYENLLNIKMKLEAEIQKYKTLLEGGSEKIIHSGSSSSSMSKSQIGSTAATTKVSTEWLIR